jgi:hypothetical protein
MGLFPEETFEFIIGVRELKMATAHIKKRFWGHGRWYTDVFLTPEFATRELSVEKPHALVVERVTIADAFDEYRESYRTELGIYPNGDAVLGSPPLNYRRMSRTELVDTYKPYIRNVSLSPDMPRSKLLEAVDEFLEHIGEPAEVDLTRLMRLIKSSGDSRPTVTITPRGHISPTRVTLRGSDWVGVIMPINNG